MPSSASQLSSRDRVLIATTSGIFGTFSSAVEEQEVEGYDFLRIGQGIKGSNYVIGVGLAWDSATTSHGTFTLNDSDFTVDQSLGSRADGMGDLVKNGSGTLSLTAENTYTGATTVNQGTLQLSGLGSISNSSAVHIDADAIVDISDVTGSTSELRNVTGDAGSTILLGDKNLSINASAEVDFSGTIEGAGGLSKTGTDTLTLSGDNTYSGETLVKNGTLQLSGIGNINGSSAMHVDTGATVDISNISDSASQINNVSGDAGSSIQLGNKNLEINASGDVDFAGTIYGNGDMSKAGNGTLTLSGNNTYNGKTIVKDGTLQLSGFGNVGGSSAVDIGTDAIVDISNITGSVAELRNVSGEAGSKL